MFPMRGVFALVLSAGFLFSFGCGGVSGSAPTNNAGNPAPNPSPSPAPSPTPTPPAPSTAPDNYSAALLATVGRNDFILNAGTVKIDTSANDGAGLLQLQFASGAPPSGTPFTLLFCPYPTTYQNIPFNYQNCTTLVNFTTSGQSNMTESFAMPKGTWSGAFELIENGVQFVAGGMSTTTPGTGFQSAMLPASSITGGIGTKTGPDTGSGSMSSSGTTLQLTVSGAMANNTYNVQMCDLNGTCQTIGTIPSNGAGRISGSLSTGDRPLFIGEIILSDTAGAEFISAFRSQ